MTFHVIEYARVINGPMASTAADGNNGLFFFKCRNYTLRCIVSDGGGWEHVSISRSDKKMPTWDDMCRIKSKFWDDEDCIVQFHPPKSEYVNNHSTCLHLWRCTNKEFPMPPSSMVGIKGLELT